MEFMQYLKQPEGKKLEFKKDLSSPDKVLRTVAAFANTAGGVLLIGVEDGTRAVRGVTHPLEEEERMANLIADGISPQVVPDMEILPWRKTYILSLRIHPGSNRPYFLRKLGPDKGVFIRVGSTNRVADRHMVDELRRVVRNESFDELPMTDLNSEAVDFRAASECFEPVRRLKRRDLETLRLITTVHGKSCPTIGGILLFGRDRLRHFPDAWIQAGRFAGKDRSRIQDHAELTGLLPNAIEEAVAFVKKHDERRADMQAVRRVDRWFFPPPAVREAIINAVVHADYAQQGAPIRISIFDDRMEIENPGLLPFGLTVEDIRRGVSKLRNRVMGRVFRELGLIEQWGSGIQRMIRACLDAGQEEPRFEEVGMHFRVTLYSESKKESIPDQVEERILTALRERKDLSTKEIADLIDRSPRAVRTRMIGLVKRGLVVEIGTDPRDPRKRYTLSKGT
jgi:predicted HTH transcriptional regulator